MSESSVESHPREVPLARRLEQLDRQISHAVERVVRELHQEIGERVRQGSQEMLRTVEGVAADLPQSFLATLDVDLAAWTEEAGAAAGEQAGADLLAAISRIDADTSQADILSSLVKEAQRFAARAAFFLTRPGEVRYWSSQGFGREAQLEDLQLDAGQGAWTELARGLGVLRLDSEQCGDIARQLHAEGGVDGVLVPFVLRGQIAGALYADRQAEERPIGLTSLQLLVHQAALALETLPFRNYQTSPTLRLAEQVEEGSDAGLPLWQPVPEPAPVATPEPQVSAPAVEEPPPPAAPAAPERWSEEPEPWAQEDVGFEEELEDVEEAVTEVVATRSPATEPEAAVEPAFAETATEFEMAEEPGTEPAFEALEEPELELETLAEPELEYADEAAVEEEPSALFVDEGVELEAEEASLEEFSLDEKPSEPSLDDTSNIWALDDDDQQAPETPARDEEVRFQEAVDPYDSVVGQQTVRFDVSAFQKMAPASETYPEPAEAASPYEEETTRLPTWEIETGPQVEEPVAEYAPDFELEPEVEGYELEPEPSEPVTESIATPDISEEPTIMSSRASLGLPSAPPPAAPPPPVVAPPPESVGSTEVKPPAGLQGPGSAFGARDAAGAYLEGEEALHEEARRLARLLVSEIKLYNEEIIEEGRRDGNVYARLKDDIDRSRQMYEERIDGRIRGKQDYFYQELVQRLAGGNPAHLGL